MPLAPEREIAAGCLGVRLRILNRLVTNVYDEALRPHGLRISQLNILVAVASEGPVRGVDVASRLRLDASTLSRDLERLVDKGWVISTSGKGRSRLLEATTEGRALIGESIPDWRKAQRTARAVLSDQVADAVLGRVESLWQGDEA